ncbi:MAG: hypothetical protein JWP11_2039 [Frankiales bacterium]|nr:hypothetical protein [Frankiales bacterium]
MKLVTALAVAAALASGGCAEVPAASSSLPAGAVAFGVTFAEGAPENANNEARQCLNRSVVEEGLYRDTLSARTYENTTAGQNRRLHICLQSVVGARVQTRVLRA